MKPRSNEPRPRLKSTKRRWTVQEVRDLKVLAKNEGYIKIAARLGRSPHAVKMKCQRLGIRVSKYTREDRRICPRCGRPITEGTKAAARGVCRVCYEADKADVMAEQEALLRERRRYDSAKHRIREMRKGGGDG